MILAGVHVFVTNLNAVPISATAFALRYRMLGAVGVCTGECNSAWHNWYTVKQFNGTDTIYHESELQVINPMEKFDAFDVGAKIILAVTLSEEEVTARIGYVQNMLFMQNRRVGAHGKILAVFPKDKTLYVDVDGMSTVMFFEEVVLYQDDVLESIINPPLTSWMPMHNWLG